MTAFEKLTRSQYRSTLYLAVTDYLILCSCFVAVMLIRFAPRVAPAGRFLTPHILTLLAYLLLCLPMLAWLDLYKRKVHMSYAWHIMRTVQGVLIITIVYIVFQYLAKASHLFIESRFVVVAWGAVSVPALLLNRLFIFRLLRRWVSRSELRRRVVIIGASRVGLDFARKWLANQDESTLNVLGFLDDRTPPGTNVLAHLPCLGQVAEMTELVNAYTIEGAILTMEEATYEQLLDLAEQCVSLFGWVDIHCDRSRCLHEGMLSDTFFDIPFVRMHESGGNTAFLVYERVFDLAASLAGIILLSPVFILCALLVKLSSPGPVYYVAERIGTNGRPFPFYKFRSLRLGADSDESRIERMRELVDNSEQTASKIVSAKYLTPIGRFLRKWALDELPQLFNVLRGDMSLVGPRPLPPAEYNLQSDWQKRRFMKVKPGCTGLWKIYAARQNISFNHTVLYDIYYTRNMSPLMDLYILYGTGLLILQGKADG